MLPSSPACHDARPARLGRPGRAARVGGGVVGLLLLAAVTGGARPVGAQTRYLAFGDSVTAGTGDDSGRGYPPRLEERLQADDPGATVEKAGVPGETTAEGLSRIDGALEGEPGVLLLMEGTNDVSRAISPETAVFNLEEMARRAGASGWEVLHATVVPRRAGGSTRAEFRRNVAFNRRLRSSAGTRGLDLADPFQVFGATADLFDRFYSDDPDDWVGHPNGDGYELLAEVFRDVLVGLDTVPPVPGPVRPAPGAEGVSATVEVDVELWDFGAGIDVLDTELLVDGSVVPATVTGGGRSARLVYTPATPLEGEVVVRLRSRDMAAPVNTVEGEVTRFVVEGAEVVQGDLDGSGRVDGVDLIRFARRFGARRGEARYDAAADFDGNGSIDGGDLAVLASNFGREV